MTQPEIFIVLGASEASSDTIVDDSRTTRSPAEGKSPVPTNRKCHPGGKCRKGRFPYDQGVQCYRG